MEKCKVAGGTLDGRYHNHFHVLMCRYVICRCYHPLVGILLCRLLWQQTRHKSLWLPDGNHAINLFSAQRTPVSSLCPSLYFAWS